MLKKILSLSLLLVLAAAPVFSEKQGEITVRYSVRDNIGRIVLEGNEDLVSRAQMVVVIPVVTVQFPTSIELKTQKHFMFTVSRRENSVSINLKDAVDIRTYKLSSPARVVIDFKVPPKAVEPTPKQEQRPQQPQPEPKKQQEISPQVSPKNPDEIRKQAAPPAPKQPAQPVQKQPSQPAQNAQVRTPAPVEKPRKRVVVIDPGHGGYDFGIILQELKEKDLDLILAKELGDTLARRGIGVFITRKADQNAAISDRINFSNSKNPDLYIGLHATSAGKFTIYTASIEDANIDTAVKQYSQFYNQNRHIEKSRATARMIGEALKAEFNGDVILRELSLPVLSSMNSPAVLLEIPLTKAFETDKKMRERVINAVVRSIE